ncbi:glycosyltransferase family 2 protein [Candidatus Uhrbacteria bacterium]|nr:glycosyltransferase family 2 protein [Candidatus Uhrbacteria bacterium]
MPVNLSLIIVSWNVRDHLRANLARLFDIHARARFEVLVVDNGSIDGTPAMIRREFPQVHLIQNDGNRGFAHACNQGLALAEGEVFVLFNPDMVMGEGVLDRVYETLVAQKDIGGMGVRLTRADGTVVASVRRDPGFTDQLAILLKLPHLFPRVVDRYLACDFDYGTPQNVEQLRGSFLAFRRDVFLQVGPLDEKNFFIWFEDVDYCRRLRQAGYRLWYDASMSCMDLVGQSFAQQPTHVKQARFSLSLARYFRAWHPAWQAAVFYALRPLTIAMGALADLVRVHSRLWK